jgi:hypothetical protein
MRRAIAIVGVVTAAGIAAALGSSHASGSARALAPADAAARPRLRARDAAVHSDDPSRAGTTAALFACEPFAAYALGRDLFTREFTPEEGLFGRPVARPLLEDGVTPVVPGSRVASCLACHNSPLHDAGAGPTIEKNGPTGRNTPHLFGAGLVEMIGWEIRLRLHAVGDVNRNGFIDKGEADGIRAVIANVAGDTADGRFAIDFGSFGDADGDGLPDLDPVCRVWFVDDAGRRLASARRLSDPGVAGYDFEVQVFGWGHTAASHAPLSSTIRGFSAAAFNVHQGLQAHDPTLNAEGDGSGVTGTSLAGAPQFFTGRTPDAGRVLGRDGASLDDPDGDGVADELTAGDMDVVEFYLLHHPAPAELAPTPRTRRGRELFAKIGCVRCHVPDWELAAANPSEPDTSRRSLGDRRRFALGVAPDPATGELRGSVEMLTRADGSPRGGALRVRGIYSDFRYHDVGPEFHQRQFDGSVVRFFKTPALWGVGSTAPYGHDGASLDLDAVVRRHGGEAMKESRAYAAAGEDDRDALLAFLRSLVLFAVDDVPVAGDAAAVVDGRFRPRSPALAR